MAPVEYYAPYRPVSSHMKDINHSYVPYNYNRYPSSNHNRTRNHNSVQYNHNRSVSCNTARITTQRDTFHDLAPPPVPNYCPPPPPYHDLYPERPKRPIDGMRPASLPPLVIPKNSFARKPVMVQIPRPARPIMPPAAATSAVPPPPLSQRAAHQQHAAKGQNKSVDFVDSFMFLNPCLLPPGLGDDEDELFLTQSENKEYLPMSTFKPSPTSAQKRRPDPLPLLERKPTAHITTQLRQTVKDSETRQARNTREEGEARRGQDQGRGEEQPFGDMLKWLEETAGAYGVQDISSVTAKRDTKVVRLDKPLPPLKAHRSPSPRPQEFLQDEPSPSLGHPKHFLQPSERDQRTRSPSPRPLHLQGNREQRSASPQPGAYPQHLRVQPQHHGDQRTRSRSPRPQQLQQQQPYQRIASPRPSPNHLQQFQQERRSPSPTRPPQPLRAPPTPPLSQHENQATHEIPTTTTTTRDSEYILLQSDDLNGGGGGLLCGLLGGDHDGSSGGMVTLTPTRILHHHHHHHTPLPSPNKPSSIPSPAAAVTKFDRKSKTVDEYNFQENAALSDLMDIIDRYAEYAQDQEEEAGGGVHVTKRESGGGAPPVMTREPFSFLSMDPSEEEEPTRGHGKMVVPRASRRTVIQLEYEEKDLRARGLRKVSADEYLDEVMGVGWLAEATPV